MLHARTCARTRACAPTTHARTHIPHARWRLRIQVHTRTELILFPWQKWFRDERQCFVICTLRLSYFVSFNTRILPHFISDVLLMTFVGML